ncbi:MAG: hypothetical protein J5803_04885, partial [Desulfovibrio sp.]|nr:hypothetical protein [Desulfovibrio sp.]
FFDPSKPAFGSIEKNALEAWRLYEKAKAGNPEAEQRQHELRTWLTKAAQNGDKKAIEALRQLPK